MPFTGELGTVNSEPENVVPMFGAGGHRYAQALSGQLSFNGSITSALTHAFRNVSLAVYRAVYRAYARWSTYSPVVKGDNPVGYWRLGEPVGAVTAFDSSGFANLGTLHGGITLGVSGGLKDNSSAMTFNGSTGYIQIPYSTLLAPGPAFSIELLTKGPNQSFVAVSFGDTNATFTKGIRIIANTNGSVTFDVNGGLGAITSPVLSTSSWHHIVGTYDGTNTRLYVDGVLVGGPTAGTYTPNDGTALYIGAQLGGSNFFTGSLEEVALYPYALTAQQVTTHYNAMTAYPPAGFTTALRTSQ